MTYRYFSHEIDDRTHYCTICGRFLKDLQEHSRWVGNDMRPACIEAGNVTAISHLARQTERRTRARV